MHDQHPAPRTEQEAEALPASGQFGSEAWEAPKWSDRTLDTSLRIRGKAMSADHPVEVRDRGRGNLDPGHQLQLVQVDRAAGSRLPQPLLRPFERARDPVQQLSDVPRVATDFVKRLRQQRSRERALLDVGPLGKPSELRSALGIQCHVEPPLRYLASLHENARPV